MTYCDQSIHNHNHKVDNYYTYINTNRYYNDNVSIEPF